MTYSIQIIEEGRSGRIRYAEGLFRSHDFYWEFCGGKAVVAIQVPSSAEWPAALGWAAGRREEVIQRVVQELTRARCPGCRVEATDGWITFYEPGN